MDVLTLILATFFFVLGSIVGSFLNVALLRYNTGRSTGGRSACMSCRRTLVWYELVPVLSFIVLRGRCRTCTSRLSFQYPLVEGATALLFLGVFLKGLPPVVTAYALVVSVLFLFIVVYDLKHLIIPRGPMYTLLGLSVLAQIVDPYTLSLHVPMVWDLVIGPLFFLFFAALFFFSGGRAVGFGDAKLSLALGLLLGFSAGLSAFVFAFWIGAVVGIALLLSARVLYFFYGFSAHWHGKSELPFAPFLGLGACTAFFFQLSLFTLFF